ncbi:MAG: hypothetical protein FJ137_04120 [Deltaproteobacteria bacterium]|nr:hypothetical protein [Deltaproteobacteria bacterium]
MPYAGLHPSTMGDTELWLDDVQLVERCDPLPMPDGFFEAGLVRRKTPGDDVAVTLEHRLQ